ncbi:Coenzyme A disulfide reductase [Porphyridium purpureum]|uniref:Coenzyme A disulfide reductase n=1 Tax=Porphyridium purpureum TaxID=35688 RepID=A0A5J4YX16_PORPP|nr:Coenzyme A disulfide reductase [Porphyridium purpureum]|eukprot:POR0794..scf209_3
MGGSIMGLGLGSPMARSSSVIHGVIRRFASTRMVDIIGKRIAVIGGVAGGASAAARARRMSEDAEITVFERGPYVSFANCGLPYYVGNVIKSQDKLVLASPELFMKRYNIRVHTNTEVMRIDTRGKVLVVKKTSDDSGESSVWLHPYDELVLSPGATAIKPSIPGIDLPGIFSIRTVPDSEHVRQYIEDTKAKSAVVVGGGFIGLEMAENLHHLGLKTTIIEGLPQVMAPLDAEMIAPVHDRIRASGSELLLEEQVTSFERKDTGGPITVTTAAGKTIESDIVIMSIGVRPVVDLAKAAGIELGRKGGISVDASMRTSQPHIYAVGDAIETENVVSGEHELVPLAGPANRQGRVAADNAVTDRQVRFRGVQSTSVCGVFGLTVASTGLSEKTLKKLGREYAKVYLHPGHHVSYYPGAKTIDFKLLYDPKSGQVLGAQGVGEEGVERRIDVLAVAIQGKMTVFDLEEVELCYAPAYGSAKDITNMAGMVAANFIRGDHPTLHADQVQLGDYFLLDVREQSEFQAGHIPNATNVPLSELRQRMDELPLDRPILCYCAVGQRGYNATRALMQNDFEVYNLSGGFRTYMAAKAANLLLE